jgi:hypothetical protein
MKFTLSDYEKIRATATDLNGKILSSLPRQTLLDRQNEFELDYLPSGEARFPIYDSVIYGTHLNGKNRAALYLARSGRRHSAFEVAVLRRMAEVRFIVADVLFCDGIKELKCRDILMDREFTLFDRSLCRRSDLTQDAYLCFFALDLEVFILGTGSLHCFPKGMFEIGDLKPIFAAARQTPGDIKALDDLAKFITAVTLHAQSPDYQVKSDASKKARS